MVHWKGSHKCFVVFTLLHGQGMCKQNSLSRLSGATCTTLVEIGSVAKQQLAEPKVFLGGPKVHKIVCPQFRSQFYGHLAHIYIYIYI